MGKVTPHPANDGSLQPKAPVPLSAEHDLSGFDCGYKELNDWLIHRARRNEGRSSRSYVVAIGRRVVAYYCLSAGAVYRNQMPKRLQRNAPDEVPIMVLGRLAVLQSLQGKGFGTGLLRDAMQRTLTVAEIVGARALVVHALNDKAAEFYQHFGFEPSPLNERTFVLPLETIKHNLQG